MQEYVEVLTADGVIVPFAVEGTGPAGTGRVDGSVDDFDGPVPAGRPLAGVRNRVAVSLEDGVDLVRSVTHTVAGKLSATPRPNKITVEVGLTVSAEAAIMVAKSTAEAHIIIKMEWDPHTDPTPTPDHT